MSEPNNILPFDTGNHASNRLSEEILIAWLDGSLSPAEQHEVEQWLADEGMESDALEGLRSLKPAETKKSVKKLNHRLRKTLLHKKHSRRKANADYFTWIAIAIVLLLAVVAYLAIRKTL